MENFNLHTKHKRKSRYSSEKSRYKHYNKNHLVSDEEKQIRRRSSKQKNDRTLAKKVIN